MALAPAPIIVDTNVLFSALLKSRTRFAELLLKSEQQFSICESVVVELFSRKEKLISLSGLSDEDLARLYHILLRRLTLCKEDSIPAEHWATARDLCSDVDATDTPHLALTLALDGLLWTGDKRLKAGLERKGFNRFFVPDP